MQFENKLINKSFLKKKIEHLNYNLNNKLININSKIHIFSS